ncbi:MULTISPECIES: hypothetical protein [Bacillus]|uniref:hypothetical protein n=1 Tax=Bacillus TaxID=1386 RepID=UPI0006FC4BB1|nr:hypothetical protein [Bacillus sp. Root920]KRE13702.1 hypothetical protein ASE42_15215 [Bacillus sp. Root920]
MNEIITAAIIAGVVSIVTGIITIIIQNKHARRTSIVDTISRQRIDWVNKMRDNFVEINDLIFTYSLKRSSYLRDKDGWDGEYDFVKNLTTIRKLKIDIDLLLNPTEEYANELSVKLNSLLQIFPKSELDKDEAGLYQREIKKLQQVIIKSEWSRTKKEIQQGKVLTDKEVKKIYTEKAKKLNMELTR